MPPSTMPLDTIAGALTRSSPLMTVLPYDAAVPSLPQHDHPRAPARLRGTEAAGEPTLEPAPEGTEEPEEASHHGGQDQHLGSLHARAAYTPTGPSRQPTTRRTAALYERLRGGYRGVEATQPGRTTGGGQPSGGGSDGTLRPDDAPGPRALPRVLAGTRSRRLLATHPPSRAARWFRNITPVRAQRRCRHPPPSRPPDKPTPPTMRSPSLGTGTDRSRRPGEGQVRCAFLAAHRAAL